MPELRSRRSHLAGWTAAAAIAGLCIVVPAAAAENHSITSRSIGGASLGLTQRDYTKILGRLHFRTPFSGGLTRLEYQKGDLHVFISRATRRGVGLFTAADEFRTSAGVGPCSPVAKLQAAYGDKLKAVKSSTTHQVIGYRLGTLIFIATGPQVRSILITTGRVPIQTALNGAACGSGEED